MMEKGNISQDFLNQIDKHIKKLSNRIVGKPNEVKDFKEEMKANLISSVQELINQGYEEWEALDIAISRFGEIDVLEDEFEHLYHKNTTSTKWLLTLTIAVGILGILLFFGGTIWNNGMSSVIASRKLLALNTFISRNVGSSDNPVTEKIKQKLKAEVDNNIFINGATVQIRDTSNSANWENRDYAFIYPNSITQTFARSQYSRDAIYNLHGTTINYNEGKKEMYITLFFRVFSLNSIHMGLALIVLYWILFTIWASLDVLHHRRIKFWVIAFFMFNIFGYSWYQAVYANTKTKIAE
jgi:hypothetical protein